MKEGGGGGEEEEEEEEKKIITSPSLVQNLIMANVLNEMA